VTGGRWFIAALAAAALGAGAAAPAQGAMTLPLADSCMKLDSPPMGPEANSDNVEHLGSLPGEAGALDAGGRLVGHYFYVTGSTHFSIYDVADPVHPKLVSRVDFPCRFENEDVAVNGDILMWSDFATTGDLYVYDVRDKRNPKLIADMPGMGTHTMECLEGCRYGFGSYHAVSSAGPLLTGEVVDLLDPAKPKVLGDWTDNGVLPTRHVHDATEVKPGFLLTASAPMEFLDARDNPAHPKVLARSDTPDDHRFHTAIWPQGGEDRFVLTSFETNGTPNCQAGSGEFAVFDASRWQETGKFKEISTYFLQNGTYFNGNPPANVLGCSPHWFNVRPSWNNGGVVALAAYDNGTQFLRVDGDGKIKEIGYSVLPGTEASGAYWITCDVVYTVDYSRGVDIYKFKDPASECQGPLNEQPSSNQPASSPVPRQCASRRRFAIHLRPPRGARKVSVTVNGRRVRVRHRRAIVDLRGVPSGTASVRIRYVLRHGRVVTRQRRYRTCVRRASRR